MEEKTHTGEEIRHLIGNPLFAIETNLSFLIRYLEKKEDQSALEVTTSIQWSVEKMKERLSLL